MPKKKFHVSWKDTTTYLVANLQAEAVQYASQYAHGKLLDVGCGRKPFLPLFRDKVDSYTGIDVPTTIHKNDGIDASASGTHLPFKRDSFDTIISTSVMEHVSEPQQMMDEMFRVLRKKGHILITVPFQYGLHEQPRDFYRYSKYALRHMAEKSGFRVVEIKPLGGAFTIMSHMTGKYIAIALYGLREKLKGKKLDRQGGFHNIKKSVWINAIAALPQGIFRLLQKIGLRKLDNLSAEVDPCIYLLVAQK